MTCGICNPEGFRDAWASSHWIDAKSTRVWGYAVSADPMALAAQTRHLIYHGAEHVFADVPSGQVRHRPGFKMMSLPIYLREDETLLLAHRHDLDTKIKQACRIEDELEARGVAVWQLAGNSASRILECIDFSLKSMCCVGKWQPVGGSKNPRKPQ